MASPTTIELTRALAPFTVRLVCAPGQREQGQTVLDLVQQLKARGALKDGASLRLAGFDLRLRTCTQAQILEVCEPDFDDDPQHQWRANVSATLAWVAAQASLSSQLGLMGDEVNLHQLVVLADGALGARQLQALRNKPVDGEDSGWCLMDAEHEADPDDANAYTAMSVMNVLRQRPEMGAVLAMPTGCAAAFDGRQLVALFDAKGELRWPVSET